jgi:hypothetical protein
MAPSPSGPALTSSPIGPLPQTLELRQYFGQFGKIKKVRS